mmetsp:Transcript_81729/g.264828  ORF Transcript_81729/g.264828 Transcript_81729/m.264828 type:complete len:309 (+) Transcript_81729:633-1559(+)
MVKGGKENDGLEPPALVPEVLPDLFGHAAFVDVLVGMLLVLVHGVLPTEDKEENAILQHHFHQYAAHALIHQGHNISQSVEHRVGRIHDLQADSQQLYCESAQCCHGAHGTLQEEVTGGHNEAQPSAAQGGLVDEVEVLVVNQGGVDLGHELDGGKGAELRQQLLKEVDDGVERLVLRSALAEEPPDVEGMEELHDYPADLPHCNEGCNVEQNPACRWVLDVLENIHRLLIALHQPAVGLRHVRQGHTLQPVDRVQREAPADCPVHGYEVGHVEKHGTDQDEKPHVLLGVPDLADTVQAALLLQTNVV